jgi:polyisoprenoid-binding protein YceI
MTARFWYGILWVSLAAGAEPHAIDTQSSTMTVHVGKSGVFSAFGHEHVISAPIASGSADTSTQTVELRINATALRVSDTNGSESDKAQIQKTMLGPELLDADRYREILFHSTSAQMTASGGWTMTGNLTLHGMTRPVTVHLHEQNGRYVGTAAIRQSEFGIKPVKVAGGTVSVKNEIRIDFDIQLRQ